MFLSFFRSLDIFKYFHVFFFLMFTLWPTRAAKSAIWQLLFLLLNSINLVFWQLFYDLFFFQNSRELCLILQDRFWFIDISFSHMHKFQFLAHISVHPLPCSIVSSFVLFFRKSGAFVYYMIDRIVSITT